MICKLILQTISPLLTEFNPEKSHFLILYARILYQKYHKLTRKPEKHEQNSMRFYP